MSNFSRSELRSLKNISHCLSHPTHKSLSCTTYLEEYYGVTDDSVTEAEEPPLICAEGRGKMVFAYLNAATGQAVGNPFMLDICDTKLDHEGITFNHPAND